MVDQEVPRRKQCRRSRAVQEGRDYDCDLCDKSYLLKSSLKQHQKIKHSKELASERAQEHGDAEPTAPMNGNNLVKHAHSPDLPINARGGPVSYLELFLAVYEKAVGRGLVKLQGDPKGTSHPIYRLMSTFSEDGSSTTSEEISVNQPNYWLNCDTVLARYLLATAHHAKKTYFKGIVLHLLLYYDCLNKLGPIILDDLIRNRLLSFPPTGDLVSDALASDRGPMDALVPPTEEASDGTRTFTAQKITDIIPRIANEFVVIYCRDFKHNQGMLKTVDLVEKTEILCQWLFANQYCQYRLIQKEPLVPQTTPNESGRF